MLDSMPAAISSALNFDVMLTSAFLALLTKVILFAIAVIVIQSLLAWMDTRAGGGARKWSEIVLKSDNPALLAMYGVSVCVRIYVLYNFGAIVFG